jgi:O-antigen/teichoic acid export membrane protein
LNAALVDAAVVADDSSTRRISIQIGLGTAILTLIGFALALAAAPRDTAYAVLGSGVFISATAATSHRLAYARSAGASGRLSLLRFSGGAITLAIVALLLRWGASWGPLTVAFSVPAVILYLLPAAPVQSAPQNAVGMRVLWGRSAPFLVSQGCWMVLTQGPIILLRILAGARAVGEYGALIRVLDLLGLVAPMMSNFALPAFVTHAKAPGGRLEVGRINALIALVGVSSVAAGSQVGWWVWRLAYPMATFPAVAFATLTLAEGASAACGLPDRILQADGRAKVVSLAGLAAAIAMVAGGLALIPAFGLTGGAVARLVALASVNVWMLTAARLPPQTLGMNLSLFAPVVLSALLSSGRVAEGSLIVTVAVSGLIALTCLGVAAPWYAALRRQAAPAS